MKKIACLLLFFSLMTGGAAAQMNKCTTPDGGIIFSDRPCPVGAAGELVELPESESTSDRPRNETYNAGEQSKKFADARRIREIDHEIEAKQRMIDENVAQLDRKLSGLQEQAEALGYVKRNPHDKRQQSAAVRFRNNALAQQGVREQIQAVVTKYRTENAALDGQIARLYDEKASLESTPGETGSVEKNPGGLNGQYEKIARERRVREIDFEIEARQGKIDENDDEMKREMAGLQRKMDAFGDNPLNESGRQSLYIGREAATSRYQLRNDALDRQIIHLRAEKSRLESGAAAQ
jgi:hypothetical protein